MAKTLSDLIADARQHIGQTDSSNSSVSDAQLTIWLNDAYRDMASALRHLPKKERDYSVASQTITLNSETVTVDDALIKNPDVLNADGSAKYQPLKVIDFQELLDMDPDYQAATADMPLYYCRKDALSMVLYPPPKASVIAQTTPLRTYGLEMPTELSATTDAPNLPSNLHTLLPHWAAYRFFSEVENQPKATEHLTLFRSRIKDNKGLATEFSNRRRGWRWDGAEPISTMWPVAGE